MAAPNSPADDLADYLVTQGAGALGSATGWSMAVSFEADTPNTHITLYDIGGPPPNAHWLLDFPKVQVRVSGAVGGYSAAWTKIQEIKDILLGLTQTTLGGTLYVGVSLVGEVNFIAYDEPGRPLLTANFQIIREPSDTTNRIPMGI